MSIAQWRRWLEDCNNASLGCVTPILDDWEQQVQTLLALVHGLEDKVDKQARQLDAVRALVK